MSMRTTSISGLSEQISTLHRSVVVIQNDIKRCAGSFEDSDKDFTTKIGVLGGMIAMMNANFDELVQYASTQPDDENTAQAKRMLSSIRVHIDATINRHKSLIRYRNDAINLKNAKREINQMFDDARNVDIILAKQKARENTRACVIL